MLDEHKTKEELISELNVLRKQLDHMRHNEQTTCENISTWVLESLPNGIIMTDFDGKIKYANKFTENITGYQVEELINQQPHILNAEVDANLKQQQIIGSLKSGHSWRGELLQRRKDGTTYPAEFEVFPVYDNNRNIIAWASIQRDITAKVQLQKLVKVLEDRFYKAFNLNPNPMIITCFDDDQIIDVNNSFLRVTGYSRQELVDSNIFEVLIQSKNENSALTDKLTKGRVKNIEYTFKKKSGDIITLVQSSELIEIKNQRCELSVFNDISQRKELQNKLYNSEKMYKNLLETANEGVWIIDNEGKNVYINDKLSKMLGYETSEMLGKSVFEFVFEKDYAMVKESLKFRRDGINEYIEIQLKKKDNSAIWANASTSSIYDNKGNYIGGLAMITDITKRKKAEFALQKSENLYRMLAENVNDVIITTDKNLKINYVSPSIKHLLGYSVEEFISLKVQDILAPDSLRMLENKDRVITGTLYNKNPFELEIYNKDKQRTWVEINISILLNKHGQFDGYLGVARDVTQRKHLQKELKQYQSHLENLVQERSKELLETNKRLNNEIKARKKIEKYLRESEKKFRTIFNYAPNGIALADLNGKFIAVNPAYCKITGYNEKELSVMSYFLLTHPEDLDNTKKALQKVQKSNKETFQYEKRYAKKDGTTVWVRISPVIVSEKGNPRYTMAVIEDITDRKIAKKKLQEAQQKAELAERMASLGTMAAGISHEINQPLNSIKITVDSMLFWYEYGKNYTSIDVQRKLNEISKQVDRIDNIIKNMRLFVAKKRIRDLLPCNLNEAVYGALSLVRHKLKFHKVTVKTKLADELLPVLGEFNRLEEIIVNLIINAIHALKEHRTEDREIFISTLMKKNVILEISDNARGISKELQQKIFEPFFTTKDVGVGMGLGLSIVHLIVKSYNGTISVYNNEKGGATFRIEFPYI